jgi:ParB-like chromosome segregation protein Spo0J
VSVPVRQIIVAGSRRPLDEDKLRQMGQSIETLGVLQPVLVVKRRVENGEEQVHLVAGRHRLEATKRGGFATIQCIVLDCDDDLHVELAEIDENLIRKDPSAAEHALLTGRRAEIIRDLAVQDGTLSQNATASRQAQRRAGDKSGHDPASVRDQANRTGETKDTVHRSRARFETLGSDILKRTLGTSLDKGVQLDALAKLPEAERENLVKRAAGGAAVSATQALREAKRGAQEEPQHQSSVIDVHDALTELFRWIKKYTDLLEAKGFLEQIEEYYTELSDAANAPEETDAPEPTSEPSKKSGWRRWRKGRKGD